MSEDAVPYRLPQPFAMPPEMYSPGALALEGGLWVPQAEGVWFRPLVFGVSGGYYVNLLRVRALPFPDEVAEFAELVGAPVVTTVHGKGAFPETHPQCLGMFEGRVLRSAS